MAKNLSLLIVMLVIMAGIVFVSLRDASLLSSSVYRSLAFQTKEDAAVGKASEAVGASPRASGASDPHDEHMDSSTAAW